MHRPGGEWRVRVAGRVATGPMCLPSNEGGRIARPRARSQRRPPRPGLESAAAPSWPTRPGSEVCREGYFPHHSASVVKQPQFPGHPHRAVRGARCGDHGVSQGGNGDYVPVESKDSAECLPDPKLIVFALDEQRQNQRLCAPASAPTWGPRNDPVPSPFQSRCCPHGPSRKALISPLSPSVVAKESLIGVAECASFQR